MHVWRNIPGKYITDKYIIDKAARFCNHSGEQYPSDYSVPVRLFSTHRLFSTRSTILCSPAILYSYV